MERELLGHDPLAVPALVEGDHAVPLRELGDRREPGQQPGASHRVEQEQRGRTWRSGGVRHVGRATSRQLDDAAFGDHGRGDGERLADGASAHGPGRHEAPPQGCGVLADD